MEREQARHALRTAFASSIPTAAPGADQRIIPSVPLECLAPAFHGLSGVACICNATRTSSF